MQHTFSLNEEELDLIKFVINDYKETSGYDSEDLQPLSNLENRLYELKE